VRSGGICLASPKGGLRALWPSAPVSPTVPGARRLELGDGPTP